MDSRRALFAPVMGRHPAPSRLRANLQPAPALPPRRLAPADPRGICAPLLHLTPPVHKGPGHGFAQWPRRSAPSNASGAMQEPGIQHFRFVLQQVLLGRAAHAGAHDQTVLFIGPIQTDPADDGRRVAGRGARTGQTDRTSRISLCRIFTHSRLSLASRKALDRRRHYRGLSRQQPLRIRLSPKRGAGSESLSRCILRQGQGNSSSQLCVTPLLEAKMRLFTSQSFDGAKVIHRRLRRDNPQLSSPPVNNFWNSYKGQGEGLLLLHRYG
jgi:hypothetical protein